MRLHTSEAIPQWEAVTAEDRNIAQNLAAATGGIVNPAHAASLIGYALVCDGLMDIYHDHTTKGVMKIGVGRAFDLVDGWLAEILGLKSPDGEFLDPVIDRAELTLALPIMAKKFDIPLTVTAMLAEGEVAKSVPSVIAEIQGNRVHPVRSAKVGAGFVWGSLLSYGAAKVAENLGASETSKKLRKFGVLTAITAFILDNAGAAKYEIARRTVVPIAQQTHDK